MLYAHNDDMAIGAIQAIEEAGLKPGVDITIISIDGVRGAFEAMKAGKLNVTVECNPMLGPQLMQLAKDGWPRSRLRSASRSSRACSRRIRRRRSCRIGSTEDAVREGGLDGEAQAGSPA